ncbi:MAG: hypothetical protein M8354_11365, partial [Halalkalicoccus sp.]|nr:hypothetical protein [Halalkalicoccus sp.]
VFVDYAHTPDAVATALRALRPHVMGRLVAIIIAAGLILNVIAAVGPDPVVASSFLVGAIPSIIVVESLRRR